MPYERNVRARNQNKSGSLMGRDFPQWIVVCLLTVVLGVVGSSQRAFAQLGTGVVTGTVSDSTGNALPGAQVTLSNVATREVFTTTTNAAGTFNFPPAIPGTYQVVAAHDGFEKQIQDHVVVQVGGRLELTMALVVGTVSQSVTVTSRTPDLNTTTAGLGVAFDQAPISRLPVNSRAALALAALTPGASSPFGSDVEGQGDRGDAVYSIMINGAPPGTANVVMDGVTLTLIPSNGEVNINPTVDSLSEFKVESGTLGASYGFTTGGAINMVSRSGTDTFHGSLYEYMRNDAFDAKNYFTPAATRSPEFRFNQFGGAVGGPIVRQKAFFFTNFEEYLYVKGVPSYTSVPTAQQRAGDFSQLYTSTGAPIQLYDPRTTVPNPNGSGQIRQPFAKNNVASEIDPVALSYQNTFYPLPNILPTNVYTNSNNYEAIVRTINTMRQAVGRVDYRLSDSNSMFFRYWYYQFLTNNPNILAPAMWRQDNMRNQNAVLGDTYVFSPRLINDFRLGGTLAIFHFAPGGENQNWPQKLGLPSSVPALELPIMNNGLPTPNTNAGHRGRTRGELVDTITWNLKSQVLSFGVDYRKSTDSSDYTSGQSGNYTFAATSTNNPQNPGPTGSQYASFLIGDVSSTTFATLLGGTDRQNTVAFFVQDDVKASPNLTFNLGLRYDYQQQPYEQNNHYSSWNPNITDSVNGLKGAYQFAGVGGVGRNFLKENYLNFGPRLGFAWAFGPGRNSVIRGGYAIYYSMQDGSGFAGSQQGFSNSTSYASTSPYQIFQLSGGIPSPPIPPLGAGLGPAAFLGQSVVSTDPHAPSPYSEQMNLTVEHQLPGGLVLQASVVNNHGMHFPVNQYNVNALDPQNYSLGLALQNQVPNPYYGVVPASSSVGGPTISRLQSLLPYPYYTSINGNYNHIGYYLAHLGSFQVTRRTQGGLTVIAGYTIGKVIDNPINFNAADISNGLAPNYQSTNFQNVYNLGAERSLDVADVSQRATISLLYDLPFGKGRRFSSQNSWVNAVAGGWQFNDITILQTGNPVSITGASNNLATRPNFVPGVSATVPHPTKSEWFNTAAFINPPLYTFGNVPRTLPNVRAPGTTNFNTSLFREFPIHESLHLSFRAEAFNVFNHPSLGSPIGAFSAGSNGLNASGTFGTITRTNIDNRELQFALKLLF
jgi:Carboxypeptidase regulatory-like domain